MGRVKQTAYECWELANEAWNRGEEPDWEEIAAKVNLLPAIAKQWAEGWEELEQ
tara:strand:+ start:51241 stop:51402 length:162 start_codon:yes stop_codon:yes gene_type:complete